MPDQTTNPATCLTRRGASDGVCPHSSDLGATKPGEHFYAKRGPMLENRSAIGAPRVRPPRRGHISAVFAHSRHRFNRFGPNICRR